jgi:hypothetical protein
MATSGKARHRNSRKPKPVERPPTMTIADLFKQRLGYKEPTNPQPFHTTARRECGGCKAVKPGSEFDVPITPGRPDLNTCRDCAAG